MLRKRDDKSALMKQSSELYLLRHVAERMRNSTDSSLLHFTYFLAFLTNHLRKTAWKML